ncbi:MAG: phosphopantothenoylcysteine decarboxylase [Verrucomicrobia bacterium]|nr:phosphopantothenoylcysteine decarboxylase [Verrucomicrobiota bacterium]
MKSKTILLGVTGSIAAYKSADIASRLVKLGHSVHAIITADGAHFITPLTLKTLTRNPVIASLYDEELGGRPTHIQLAEAADLLLIAPATANVLAKLAHGIADDALSTIALATSAPILAAPAMNNKMWDHPATQENVRILKKRGVRFIGPEEGLLACGSKGVGRLCDPDEIVKTAAAMLK